MGLGHRAKAVSPVGLAMPQPQPEVESAVSVGQSPTLEGIYQAHSKTVARWAMRLLGPKDDYEDVVQEVFLVVRRRLSEFRGEAEISTWLYEITVRVAQGFRRRARWWAWATGRGRSPSRSRSAESIPPWFEPAVDPEAMLEARERTRLLYRLLDELAEEQRTTFILFELEGLSGHQIAEITQTSVATVWVRLSRARRRFLDRMRDWETRAKP
jgi:RNA polymerase sigma-70 factor, ECF subfamily